MSSLELPISTDGTPSSAQLAFALAIVKLKPSNASIREHIGNIRSHIREGRKERDWNVPNNHLDSIAFWQQAYEKSEASQSQLLDKIYDLERRNDALMDRLRSLGTESGQESGKTSLKRRTNAAGVSSTIPTTCKRSKHTSTDTEELQRGGIGIDESIRGVVSGVECSEGNMAPFLRQLYDLQQLLQKKLNIKNISLATVELCKSGERVITSAFEPSKQLSRSGAGQKKAAPQPSGPDPISTLRLMEQSYPCLLRSLKRVSAAEKEGIYGGLIIYHIILLFKGILDGLQLRSTAAAKESLIRMKQAKKSKGGTKSNTRKTARVSATMEYIEDDNITKRSAHLLKTMILSLEPSLPEQCNLLEGYLFFVLDRVGKILSLFVLGDLRTDRQLRLNPSELPLPTGLLGIQDDDITRKGAESECRYLVDVLESILGFMERNKDGMTVTSLRSSSVKRPSATSTAVPTITTNVRMKLQATLLKAVFGDQDPCFKDSLSAPQLSDVAREHANQDVPPPLTAETPEWFTREIWRLLGWDILSRGNDEGNGVWWAG